MEEKIDVKYELNKIYNEDCYEAIKNIPDKSIDCIYTDPPYDFKSSVHHKNGFLKNRVNIPGKDIINLNINNGYNLSILDEFVRVMKNINIFLWCNKHQIKDYLEYFSQFKDVTFEILMWHKTNPIPMTSNMWLPDTEYCLYFRDSNVKLNDGYDLKSKYYISPINKEDKDLYLHPTIKPLELVKRHLLHTTNEGGTILDPFIGSGTTAVAAKELNRNFIGFEINKKYYDIACDRLNGINANGQTSIFTDFDNL